MNFELAPFTNLLSAIIDNRGKTCPVGGDGIPLIATNCVDGKNLYPSYETTRYVTEETYRTWFRGHPRPGDILFVCKGSPGRTNWVPDPVDFCIAQDMVAVRADPTKVAPKYLFAALRSSIVQSQISNMHVGTMIPHFKKGDFDKLNIPLPIRSVQDFIGDFYFTLSERISLLRETNATLEAIGQALFKSWFVDFEPVHAKQQGLAPEGMDEATAGLFPDGFEESELGLVPRGWRVGALGEELKIAYGKNLPTANLLTSGYPVYGGNGRIGFFDKYRYETRQVLIACRGAASGKVNQSCPKAFVTNNSLILESNESTRLPFGYLKGYMLGSDLMPFVTGSAQPQVTIDNLKLFKLLIPRFDVLKVFESFSSVIEDKIEENDQQAQTLTTLRDTLLPRLISGQLRLPEAEAVLAELEAA